MASWRPTMTRPCPKGTHVDVPIGSAEVTPELQSEFAQWEKASDEAWTMVDRWEEELAGP